MNHKKRGNTQLGTWGEQQAAAFLIRLGYEMIGKNFRSGKYEIDIIAHDSDTDALCFVEVKTRAAGQGSAERSVKWDKQMRIQKVAFEYCLMKNIDIDRKSIRFEVVSVYVDKKNSRVRLRKFILPT